MNNSKKEIEKRANKNLIEANTKLVDENKWLKIDYEILKKRNEKAIEYIENKKLHQKVSTVPTYSMQERELLDILRGDDKE